MLAPVVAHVEAPAARTTASWHCLGLADSFRDGDPPAPHAVRAFGTKLVVFADSAASCTCSTRTAGTWAAT